MQFSEKVRQARKAIGLSQDELAVKVGKSRRTVTDWESGRSYPRTREVYAALSEALNVPQDYLMTESEAFITDAGEQFGYRGMKGAERLVTELTGLFAGGEMAEEDMDTLMLAVQQAYVDAKKRNKKYGRGTDEPSER